MTDSRFTKSLLFFFLESIFILRVLGVVYWFQDKKHYNYQTGGKKHEKEIINNVVGGSYDCKHCRVQRVRHIV